MPMSAFRTRTIEARGGRSPRRRPRRYHRSACGRCVARRVAVRLARNRILSASHSGNVRACSSKLHSCTRPSEPSPAGDVDGRTRCVSSRGSQRVEDPGLAPGRRCVDSSSPSRRSAALRERWGVSDARPAVIVCRRAVRRSRRASSPVAGARAAPNASDAPADRRG